MHIYTQDHLTSAIVMVRPIDFGYNEQTGADNEFQHQPEGDASVIRQAALAEFETMVDNLNNHAIDILVLDTPSSKQTLPDAVFPNNWFSTRQDGSLFIYPMKTPNRQAEVQVDTLCDRLSREGYQINPIIDVRDSVAKNVALEGTGSLIFHHPSGQIFAAISERCERDAITSYAQNFHYQLNCFNSQSAQGHPIYHTNVLMTCGENFAVIAESTLVDNDESKIARQKLEDSVADVIKISEAQMTENFCGNILQLKNRQGQPCIVMSASAHQGFSANQLRTLEKHGELIICAIPTIEHIGGGSARCMIAENFLPKNE